MQERRILVVGSGGREHAIIWKLAQSPDRARLYAAPGNAGTALAAENVPIAAEDKASLVAFATANAIDLVIVGPEVPLAAGLVDDLAQTGIAAFGPTAAAARIEASKAFAKDFMMRNGIPTAAYGTFDSSDEAHRYIDSVDHAVVVKADGLAAGKGVILCDTRQEAHAALTNMLENGAFGEAGSRVVIEQQLVGPEVSLLAFCDGQRGALMPPARDHKRVFERDTGPNTGGMGAYAPVPDLTPQEIADLGEQFIQPVLRGLAAAGTPYIGVLYAGLILTPDGPMALEYNCRFGDPETQVLLPLLGDDLLQVIDRCMAGDVGEVVWHDGAAVTVVAASGGYPGSYEKGLPISGLETLQDVTAFHAGTQLADDGRVLTSGGRVLALTARGRTVVSAADRVYHEMPKVAFEGMHYRSDIGRVLNQSIT